MWTRFLRRCGRTEQHAVADAGGGESERPDRRDRLLEWTTAVDRALGRSPAAEPRFVRR